MSEVNQRAASAIGQIRALGYSSVQSFLNEYPSYTYQEVWEMLEGVAPMDVMRGQVLEVSSKSDLAMLVSDTLARHLLAKFPDGWPSDQSGVLIALAGWATFLEMSFQTGARNTVEPHISRALARFRKNPPPEGWRPSGADAPIIREAICGS